MLLLQVKYKQGSQTDSSSLYQLLCETPEMQLSQQVMQVQSQVRLGSLGAAAALCLSAQLLLSCR